MQIGMIVQARMSSTRLDGKVLYEVAGKPLLGHLLERLRRCKLAERIVVATSCEESDDAIEFFCRSRGVDCCRGPLDNVAERFRKVVEQYDFDGFVRVCADSPLLDQRWIDRAVKIFIDGNYDIVTNTYKRSFPKGQSIEVVRSDTFKKVCELMSTPDEREHITQYFYQRSAEFKIFNISLEKDYSWLQLSVDEPKDLKMFENILRSMNRPSWEYNLSEILRLAIKSSGVVGTGKSV